ncbi:bifunctional diguanylate cyclase/phosphodiesterase [Devosia pacifica]|uniref:Bifunctional diguanylate cyclase/phosphodiesterase n=1 Tax=Devosia pacifica TaxID=1335967 RepID=A0A918S293_9HYPH|nr:EAL domain-containing protein [Devosia pacifica]GHA17503.1 bifunctional diguanylate cyclase/phosphodiesterase [Devosia pacifica]
MSEPNRGQGRLRFAARVVLPVVSALLITGTSVIAFLFWTAAEIDDRARERQLGIVREALSDRMEETAQQQESVVVSDTAVGHVAFGFDQVWISRTLGQWMHHFFGHDMNMLVAPDGTVRYAMQDGRTIDTPPELAPQVASQVAAVRREIAGGALHHYRLLNNVPLPRAGGFLKIDGEPAIVSAVPIISDSGRLSQTAGNEYIHVSVAFLDDAVAGEIARKFRLEEVSFDLTPSASSDRANYPVMSPDGRIVAFVSWKAERPGAMLLRQSGPALAMAFAVATLLMIILLRWLRQFSTTAEARRIHAEYMASHDRLTGLYNRNQFDDELETARRRNHADNVLIHIMLLDLDRFKQVNDTLGHQAGDELIRAVGSRLRPLLRPADRLARLGGDEFGILHVSSSSQSDMLDLSRRIIDTLGRPFDLGRSTVYVGVSIGIVTSIGTEFEPQELLRKADIALYEAKAAGRNRAVLYHDQMDQQLQTQHWIEGELRKALKADGQLSVAYQPLVAASSQQTVGAEALVRWTHPTLGRVSPARFIPVAETSGLIEELGTFVLRQACKMGVRHQGKRIAVNISPTQLRNPAFPQALFSVLRETGMSPENLELEITESILLDDEKTANSALTAFREKGIRIALDDFGTGYSSLNYLKRYPVDRIKIDQSFVRQLNEGHASVAIVQALVSLAHAMNMDVTAEGVETSEQARILTQLRCNTLQGYLFSHPIDEAEISAWFAEPEYPTAATA